MDPKTKNINSLYNLFQNKIVTTNKTGNYNSVISTLPTITTRTEENNEFVVSIDSSFNNRLFVQGDVIMNSRLFLTNPNTLYINGILYGGTGKVLSVFSDISVNGNINVGGLSSLNNTLFVGSDVSINTRLFLNSSSIYIDGGLMQNLSNFQTDVSINKTLSVYEETTFYGDATGIGNIIASSYLYANNAEIYNNIQVDGILSTLGPVNAANSVILGQTNSIIDPSDTGLYLDVSGSVNFRNTVLPFRLTDDSTLYSASLPLDISNGFGNSWIKCPQNGLGGFDWRKIAVSANGQVQAAVAYGTGIFVSTNFGLYWTKVTPSYLSPLQWISIAISANGQIQSAIVQNGGIYLSTNYGNSWTMVTQPDMNNLNFTDITMCSMGKYQTVVSNGDLVYISNDYGNYWIPVNQSNMYDLSWNAIKISANG